MVEACVVLLENGMMNYCGRHGLVVWTLDFVLCALCFVRSLAPMSLSRTISHRQSNCPKAQVTKYQVQSTKYKAQSSSPHCLDPKPELPAENQNHTASAVLRALYKIDLALELTNSLDFLT